MPEFRFRRKKQQNRRKTVNDPVEAAKQVTAAKQLDKSDKQSKRNSISLGADLGKPDGQEWEPAQQDSKPVRRVDSFEKLKRSSLVQEREKFFELLKTKYPEQASNLDILTNGEGEDEVTNGHDSVGLNRPIGLEDDDNIIQTTSAPSLTAQERTIANSYGDCLFLRYGKSVRHCPMPSPITLSTVKNLYRNLFDISDRLLNDSDCSLYFRPRGVRQWEKLVNISLVTDHCTLLLVEPGHIPDHTPSPGDSDINTPLELSRHATQESQGSQPHSSSGGSGEGGGSHTSVGGDSKATPTSTQAIKQNGLWRSGRSREVEDLTRLSDTQPLHGRSITSPLSLTSSTSGVYSEPPIDPKKLTQKAHLLQTSVADMKSELKKLRQDHVSKMADFSLTIKQTSNQISAALGAFMKLGGVRVGSGGEAFRRERLELYREEESYGKLANETWNELELLEIAVEEMRVDVVERRCGVREEEVATLSQAVSTVTNAVTRLQDQFAPLESKMKRVMEGELQTVVREENFLHEEAPKVIEATQTCSKLLNTLGVLNQFANVQSHRTPLVPYFSSVTNPDRHSLLENIQAVVPNHTYRVERLKKAEAILRKKKELHSPMKARLKEFESQLHIKRDHLHHVEVSGIEKRHEMKIKSYYMEERFRMEKELEKELNTERMLAAQKREQRKKQMDELWKWKQKAKMEDEKSRQMRSIQIVMQDAGSSSGSNRSIPGAVSDGSSGQLHVPDPSNSHPLHKAQASHHTRASSDDQTHYPHPSHSHSNSSDTTPPKEQIHLVAPPKGKRFRKKDYLKPWQRKSIGYVGEFENTYQTIDDTVKSVSKTARPDINPDVSKSTVGSSKSHDHGSKPSSKIAISVTTATSSGPPLRDGPISLGPKVTLESNGIPRQPQPHASPPVRHPIKQSNNPPVKSVGHSQNQPTVNMRQNGKTTTSASKPPTSGQSKTGGSKRSHVNGIPNRYSMYEYHSQPDNLPAKNGYKNSSNSLSQHSEEEYMFMQSHMQPMLTLPEADQKRNTIGGRTRGPTAAPVQKPVMKRSNSDDSIYESSTLERRKAHGLTNAPYNGRQQQRHNDLSPTLNRKWAMNVFNRDTLPVELRQADNRHGNNQRVRNRNSSASSGSSGGRQGSKVIGQSSHPHSTHGQRHHPSHHSVPRNRVPDVQPHSGRHHHHHHDTKHSRTCPAHPHNHGGAPIRVTKSAQTPFVNGKTDAPLTSYPRAFASATHTLQMRTVSNGAVQQPPRNRVTNYPGHVMSGGSHVTRHIVEDPSMGSLV